MKYLVVIGNGLTDQPVAEHVCILGFDSPGVRVGALDPQSGPFDSTVVQFLQPVIR